MAEWWYNTHYHSSTQLTPYEGVYGKPPPLHLPYLQGESAVDEIYRSLQRREHMIDLVKFHLARAQTRMKNQADKKRSDRTFSVGDWVWLKLQPYRQVTVQHRNNQKLSPKYYGPFQVIDCVGKVAYKLQLPNSAKIHNVFHVSQLKVFHGSLPIATHIPTWLQGKDSSLDPLPTVILDQRSVQSQNQTKIQFLVQLEDTLPHDATWVVLPHLSPSIPNFQSFKLEDKFS